MTGLGFPLTEEGAEQTRFEFADIPNSQTKRTLLFRGKAVAQIEGLELKAHFLVPDIGWLIVADFDCPFEELAMFHLLRDDFESLDSIRVGKMGCVGFFMDMKASGPHEFLFEFPDKGDWHKLLIEPWVEGFLLKKNRWLKVTLANGERSPFV